ncbi:MAG: hypothetical protein A3H45_03425 [Ignavibacteria bacterium RIFCSPLOWO2_02_FULL_55_14]|nr:MAG: hypothetical protein A2X68_12075 [Ignavibacteria bacterium GWC2_56_12]OGU69237.1 MAG: hypothetical protein A3H45_03425 [Ignavibacteria bacterium RIFCSPLOWO2_02_FULL_55_14]
MLGSPIEDRSSRLRIRDRQVPAPLEELELDRIYAKPTSCGPSTPLLGRFDQRQWGIRMPSPHPDALAAYRFDAVGRLGFTRLVVSDLHNAARETAFDRDRFPNRP